MPKKAKRAPYPHETALYAAYDQNNRIIVRTIRERKEDCLAEVEKLSPAVDGFPPPLHVVPIYAGRDLNRQLDMLTDPEETPCESV